MEDKEIINLWKQYDKELEGNLLFNRQIAADITQIKVKSFLISMQPLKVFTVLAGIVWAGFIDVLLINLFPVASPFFLVSAVMVVLLNKIAIGIYLYQLILLHRVDINEPIVATQEKVSRLMSSTLWVTRFLLLQFPFWTTFYWDADMLKNGNVGLWLLQVAVTLAFTYAAIWFFCNIKYENKDKKWFRFIFKGKEWDPIIQSMELLSQIKEYKKETSSGNARGQ